MHCTYKPSLLTAWCNHWIVLFIERIEIQLFCYLIYSQVMGNENGLLTGSIPITIPYDAIFSNNSWSVTYCLVQGRQRAALGPHAAPWPISLGPRALLQKSRRLQKLLLLFADNALLYLHRWLSHLRIWNDTVLSCISWNFQTGEFPSTTIEFWVLQTVHHFRLNRWLRPPKISHWVDVARLMKSVVSPGLNRCRRMKCPTVYHTHRALS